jgi:hypothetical protein
MLHPINLDLMRASVRHHPDGRPKDPHEHHAHEVARLHRTARRMAIQALLGKIARALRLRRTQAYASTSTVAQVSKHTPPASAMTPIVARPPRPLSGPKTSTSRSDNPDETLCTSS